MKKTLVVFDMDMTLSEGILQEAYFLGMNPEAKWAEYQKGFRGEEPWPILIQRAVTKYPPSLDDIQKYLSDLPMVKGMKQVLELLHSRRGEFQIVLISGSNKMLIEMHLQRHGCNGYFSKIHANPSSFDGAKGTYNYKNTLKKCSLPHCKDHSCKAHYLAQILAQRKHSKTFYIGDGLNDLCGMSLVKEGYVFIREGKQLHKKMKDEKENGLNNLEGHLNVKAHFWSNGFSLADILRSLF